MALSSDFLKAIFDDDTFGIIDKVEIKKASKKEEFNLADSKEKEVSDWVESHGREPDVASKDSTEHRLAVRLKAIRDKKSSTPKEILSPFDDPLLDKMMAGLPNLSDFTGSVLKPREEKRQTASYSTRRANIPDFSKYQALFDSVQKELDEGKRKTVKFTATGLKEGKFYIVGGLLCLIDEVYENERNSFGRLDKRLHIVFANHTEGYFLLASFRKMMSEDGNGRCLTEPEVTSLGEKINVFEDTCFGYIYIVRSLSTEPEVTSFGKNLYKVGYTGGSVEQRISNAINEPTYLCAPVKLVESWRCVNLNAKALETFLHKFFAEAQVQIRVKGNQIAKEWFNLPLEVLEASVPMILDGSIRNYYYDDGRLVRRR